MRSKYGKTFIFVGFLLLLPAPVEIFSLQNGDPAQAILRLIQKNGIKDGQVGISMYSTQTRSFLVTHNGEKPMATASNMKLFTTATAMARLGTDFSFNTPLMYRGTVGPDGVLDGDLVVIGDGDPNISGRFHDGNPTAIFEQWADKTKELGITRVRGDLVLDDHIFDDEFVNPAWDKEDLSEWYAAPVGALSLNDNCIDIKITGNKREGKKATVTFSPDTRYVSVINKTMTVKSKPKKPIVITRNRQNQITVQGDIQVNTSGTFYTTIDHPTRFFGAVLMETMEARGIAIEGTVQIRQESDLSKLHEIARFQTPLIKSIRIANRNSQNFYAECLLKRLGHKLMNKGTTAAGIQCVQEFLTESGIGPIPMVDGSGLARGNRAAPDQITALLKWLHAQPFADAFRDSMAVSGEKEGTLKHRFHDPDLAGRIRAKTGYIAGVKSISGYVDTRKKDRIIFSILVNDVNGKQSQKVNQLQDDILRLLITDY